MSLITDDATLGFGWDGPINAFEVADMRWLHLYSIVADRSLREDRVDEAETDPLRPLRPGVFARWADRQATSDAFPADEVTPAIDGPALADEASAS